MRRLRELIHEVHRRSLWQVLSLYVAGSWGTYQAVEMVVENTALPDWVLPLALVLMLVGLPIVIATAFVQEGVHRHQPDGEIADETATANASVGKSVAHRFPRDRAGQSASLFTWRNTLLGGLGAFALVGLVSVGWLVRAYVMGEDPGLPPAEETALIAEPAEVADASKVEGGADPSTIEGGADDAGGATGETPPPPPPPPPAEAANTRVRAALDASRTAAQRARSLAGTLRTAETSPSLWQVAESELRAGESAAGAGRYADAAAAMDRAGTAYARATADADATWQARVATARSELALARDAADPDAATEESTRRLQEEASRLEGAGDLPGALDALNEASAVYRSAATPTPLVVEAVEPEEPSPREIVNATLAQLSQALASEDIAAVRRVWTSLSAQQASNFESFFARYDDLRATYEPRWQGMTSSAGQIRVPVTATWRYVDDGHEEQQPPFEETFVLSDVGGRWVITDG